MTNTVNIHKPRYASEEEWVELPKIMRCTENFSFRYRTVGNVRAVFNLAEGPYGPPRAQEYRELCKLYLSVFNREFVPIPQDVRDEHWLWNGATWHYKDLVGEAKMQSKYGWRNLEKTGSGKVRYPKTARFLKLFEPYKWYET